MTTIEIGGPEWQAESFPPRPTVLDEQTTGVLEAICENPGMNSNELRYRFPPRFKRTDWVDGFGAGNALVFWGRVVHTKTDRYSYYPRNAAELKCPECGQDPGAASTPISNGWEIDFCESCGWGDEETGPPANELDSELPDDPSAYAEEMRRLHESQA
jgi:hypothetical protein